MFSVFSCQRFLANVFTARNFLRRRFKRMREFWREFTANVFPYCGYDVSMFRVSWRGASCCHVAISLNSLKKMMALLCNDSHGCFCRCLLQMRAPRVSM